MRWPLVILGLVISLFIAFEFVGRQVAEDHFEEGIASGLQARGPVTVSLAARPFLLHAVRSSFPRVEIGVGRATLRGVDIAEAQLNLFDVEFEPAGFLPTHVSSLSAASGTGTLSFSERVVNENLGRSGSSLSVTIRDTTIVLAAPDKDPRPADITLDGKRLEFRTSPPRALSGGFALPAFSSGLRYEEVKVDHSKVEVDFDLNEGHIPPSPGPDEQ